MPDAIEPRPAFREYSKDEIIAALESPDHLNPIAQEVARLLDGYTRHLVLCMLRLGYIPSYILRAKPRWPIEAVVMRLIGESFKAEFAAGATPH